MAVSIFVVLLYVGIAILSIGGLVLIIYWCCLQRARLSSLSTPVEVDRGHNYGRGGQPGRRVHGWDPEYAAGDEATFVMRNAWANNANYSFNNFRGQTGTYPSSRASTSSTVVSSIHNEVGTRRGSQRALESDCTAEDFAFAVRLGYTLQHETRDLPPSNEEASLRNEIFSILDKAENGKRWNALQLKSYKKSLDLVRNLQDNLFLSRKLVLPEELSQQELLHGLNYLQELQQPKTKIERSVPHAQKLLLLEKKNLQRNFIQNEIAIRGNLIIGVDATPAHYGGYCVNLQTKTIEYYVIKSQNAPWVLNQWNSSDEFEMKNFLLALTIWNNEIEVWKSFSMFTDNMSIMDKENFEEVAKKYGGRVRNLLQHFVKCQGAVVNERMFINRTKDVRSFAKFIQPADDLSRLEIKSCVDFLCNWYEIDKENVKGTCISQLMHGDLQSQLIDTSFHNEALKTAKTFIQTFKCNQCISTVNLSASIRSKLGRNLPSFYERREERRRRVDDTASTSTFNSNHVNTAAFKRGQPKKVGSVKRIVAKKVNPAFPKTKKKNLR